MTTVIERFSIALAEEGARAALVRTGWTVVIALSGYAVMAGKPLQHFLFVFPESTLVIMGLLLIVGRYTGYRLSDILRFRVLAPPTP